MHSKIVEIEELTKIHTGDAKRDHVKLRETGILGSLRWWYEAVIRGYGDTACDPTNTECNENDHCDACELFGCTGWSRKFRFEIEEVEKTKRLKFYPLRNIANVEWALLNKTLNIIADYGAIGGKIAEGNYGLIEIISSDIEKYKVNKKILREYLKNKGSSVDIPDIKNFFFINKPDYGKIKDLKEKCKFLKGKGPGKAKTYFCKTKDEKPYRYFAYAENPNEFQRIKEFLDEQNVKYLDGNAILELKEDDK